MGLNPDTVSCKKFAKVFAHLTKYPYDLCEFTRNVLSSEYKHGLENQYLLYYSQGIEYYYECFKEWFPNMKITNRQYDYERLYWMGYLFQHWYVKQGITGEKLEKMLTDEMINKLYELWDIYHTQDMTYVFEDVFNGNYIKE